MTDMGNEMKGYIVGPMPAIQFLDEFFPKRILQNGLKAQRYQKGCFDNVVSCTGETQAYEPFVSFIYYDYAMFFNLSVVTDHSCQTVCS